MPSKNWIKKRQAAILRPILFNVLEDSRAGNNGTFYVVHEKIKRRNDMQPDDPMKAEADLLLLCLEDICALGGMYQVQLGTYGNKKSKRVSEKISQVVSSAPLSSLYSHLVAKQIDLPLRGYDETFFRAMGWLLTVLSRDLRL